MGIYIRREGERFSLLFVSSLLSSQKLFESSKCSSYLQDFFKSSNFSSSFFPDLSKKMSEKHQEVPVTEEGPVPVLKWDLGLFEQIVRSFRFPPEWGARYPDQGQTAADAPPGYITLYEDFFLQGNFRLPATNFLGNILHHYNFHISQMSPPGMVRVRHFEFLCHSHGIEASVDKFRAFYQLQRTMGFFSFASRGAAKKILLNPPKSFHDWKPKFFFIREEVLPIAMPFRDWTEAIPKEDLPIPKTALWYQQLTPTPNRVFGENVLVAARMSDQWSPSSREVPVLKLGDQEAQLYQAAFTTFGGSMGVRLVRDDEESWYDQIKGNFMFPVADAFASPPTATEGAHYPKTRPLRSVTSAGKEVVYLSSEESVGSSSGALSSWSKIFADLLRDLGIDSEEKMKRPVKKKKADVEVTSKGTGTSHATTAAVKGTLRLRQRDLDDYLVISDSFEGLSHTTKAKTGAGGSKSSGSAGSRNPDAGATPSVHEDEETEEEDVAAQLIGKKRGRSETTAVAVPAPTATWVPLIGKTSNLRSLYKFSPGMFFLLPLLISHFAKMYLHYFSEIKKKTPEKGVTFSEAGVKRPKITIKPTDTAAQDAAKAAEAQRKVEEGRKREEEKRIAEEKKKKEEEERKKKEEERKRREEEARRKAEEARLADVAKKKTLEKAPEVARPTQSGPVISKGSGRVPLSSASSGGAGGYNPNVIGAKDTIGDIYYKSYNEEERGDAIHQAPWSLKQKYTFQEFGPTREWFLNSFPPAEVNRQRAKPHELLYRAFILGEANARAANHQIVTSVPPRPSNKYQNNEILYFILGNCINM
ncbi:hypothetical protein Hdeb2414_s0026g00674391 [Helianthus debilis subsp. tardiflorus]